jgi:CDP-paratose 2-epimerase
MRRVFFGDDASTQPNAQSLIRDLSSFTLLNIDIRDENAVNGVFKQYGSDISIVVHTAGQPSHDWAAQAPLTDFSVNATGTLVLLEATRNFCPEATFIFTSTNKVYGDAPNTLPLVETDTRWELAASHPFAEHGINEEMSIDQNLHSVFGASKVAADVMVQEYGRYFGLNTAAFRCGCLTGPNHAGTHLHGFLAYLVLCLIKGTPYTIHGYKGKQVRDNLHAADLIQAFWEFHLNPRPGSVYNMGGSRHANCSVLEAITLAEELSGKKMNFSVEPTARIGDHIWWISDVRRFQADYPTWKYKYDLAATVQEILDAH